MRITKLSLTNFRSFKETQTIEFAPVTLLFGPNSVGKSTVLLALFYLQQIVDKGECNPQKIDALGGKFVDGFENMVNGRDLSKRIKFKIEYDMGTSIGSDYSGSNELLYDIAGVELDLLIMDMPSGAYDQKVAIEFEIAWSFTLKTAYIASYSVWFDGDFIGEITADAGLKNPIISKLNFGHALLCDYFDARSDWLREMYQTQECLLATETKEEIELNLSDGEVINNQQFSDDGIYSRVHFLIHQQFPIGIKGMAGALPRLGKKLVTSLDLESKPNEYLINTVLSELFVSPLDNLLSILSQSLCIGPLRIVPDSSFKPNPYPKQGDWYNGQACWDELAITDIKRDHSVNSWLADDKLNLGYKLIYQIEEGERRFITPSFDIQHYNDLLAVTDAIGIQIEQLHDSEDSDPNKLSYEDLEASRTSQDLHSKFYKGMLQYKKSSVSIWDERNNVSVSPADIGVGVSQLLPLIVASYTRKKGIIACEQPELHVHPRVQVAIGDLLTQVSTNATYLIETHSEHLILRLLKRVRQTAEGNLPKDLTAVKPEDISVIFLSNSTAGIKAKRIDITEDGDFVEDWPGGFFEERDEELF